MVDRDTNNFSLPSWNISRDGQQFYPVETSKRDIAIHLSVTALVTLFVLFQNFRIISLIWRTKKLRTPGHHLVIMLLSWDSIMLANFTTMMFFILLNHGIWLNTFECKLMYFALRLFRSVQITNFTFVAVEKALFIISPYKYEVLFDTKIPTVTASAIYIITSALCISSFYENVKFSTGALTCTASVFASHNPYLTLGIVIRALLFFICIVCLILVTSFAAYFNIKEKRAIRRMTPSIEREFFNGMVRNIVINSIMTCSWSLQWGLIAMMNNSEDNATKGRIAAILYHCFVALVNPIMVRVCYKPIREGLKRNTVSPTTIHEDQIMNEEMSIETFLYDSNHKKRHAPKIDDTNINVKGDLNKSRIMADTVNRVSVGDECERNCVQKIDIYVIEKFSKEKL